MRAGWLLGIGVAALGCSAPAPEPVATVPRPAVDVAAAPEEAPMPVAAVATPVTDLDRAVPARLATATFALG